MAGVPVAVTDVHTVCCVGAGVIGGGRAAYFLAQGYDVVAWDPAPDAEARLRHLVDAAWPALTQLGLAEGADPSRLRFEPELGKAVAGPSSCRRVRRRCSTSRCSCSRTSTRRHRKGS